MFEKLTNRALRVLFGLFALILGNMMFLLLYKFGGDDLVNAPLIIAQLVTLAIACGLEFWGFWIIKKAFGKDGGDDVDELEFN